MRAIPLNEDMEKGVAAFIKDSKKIMYQHEFRELFRPENDAALRELESRFHWLHIRCPQPRSPRP